MTVPITALAFSPDGQQVAASGYHEITLWKTADGTLDRRLQGLSERIYDIAYSADGKWLATASGDPGQYGLARLWAAEPAGDGKPVRDLAESQDVVFAVAFSPDGKKLATAGADRIVRVFEIETGKLLAQIEDHADWIFDIAFSPDGKKLATASRDKTSKVFDVEKKESLVTFTGHGQPVYTVAFTPDGKAVTTGGEDNLIRVWTIDGEAKQVREIGGFGGTVFKLRYSPDGKILAACSGDKSVRHLQGRQRRRGPHAPGPQRLGLLAGDLARRQDPRLGKLGRRGPPLEPGRRQAAADHPRRPGLQARREPGRAVSRLTRPVEERSRRCSSTLLGGISSLAEHGHSDGILEPILERTNLGVFRRRTAGFPLRSFDADLYFHIGRMVDHRTQPSGHRSASGRRLLARDGSACRIRQ